MIKRKHILNIIAAILVSCVTMPEDLELNKEMIADNINKPLIASITGDTLLAVKDSLRLVCSASGASLVYTWFADTNLLYSGTDSTFKIDSLALNLDSTHIFCIASNNLGTDTSDSSLLEVLQPPVIIEDPKSSSIKFGNNAIFMVSVNGCAPLTYQWLLNDSIVQNSDSSKLIIANTELSDSGKYYKCIVSNPVGIDTSKIAILSVLSNIIAPEIIKHPSHLNKTVGNSASFSIMADGTDIEYQWLRNDSLINNATSSSYTIDSVMYSHHGSKFKCIAKNTEGADTSNEAILTVSLEDVAPKIINEPDTALINIGQSATFSVEANGTNLKYQWFRNDSTLLNETDDSYTENFTTMNDSGSSYYCIVSNSLGEDTSIKALLHIIDTIQAPAIKTDLVPATIVEGNSASFSIEATGTDIKYSWLIKGIKVDSLTDNSVTFNNPTVNDSGTTIQCLVYNLKDTIESKIVVLHVTKTAVAISISTEPTTQVSAVDSNAIFSVEAKGSDIVYQWFMNDTLLSSQTAYQLNLENLQFSDSGALIYCNLKNSLSNINSDTVLLHVLRYPSITTDPSSEIAIKESSVTFTVKASGSGPFNYQWYENGSIIDNATLSYYTISAVTIEDNGKQFSCKVSNAIGFETSNSALLTVAELPVITGNSGSLSSGTGQNAEFWVTATGTAPLSYQWFVDGDSIIGADSNYYTLESVTNSDNGKVFTCKISNIAGEITSTPFVLTVVGYPTVNISPDTLSIAENGTNFFKASITGEGNLQLFWYRNDTLLTDEKDSILVIKNATPQQNWSQYYCIVTNEAGLKDTTEIGILDVVINPTVALKDSADTINAQIGDEVSLEVTTTGSAPINLQWYNNGVKIDGAIFPKYTIDSITTQNNSSLIYCIATNKVNVSDTTDSVYIGVYEPVNVTNTLPNPNLLINETATFEVKYTGSTPITIQWYKNGSPINGADNLIYTTPALTESDNGNKYFAIVSNGFNSDSTNIATVTVTATLNYPFKQLSPLADPDIAPGYKDSLTPMFVCFAIDRNEYVDAAHWLMTTLDSRSNPAGAGNSNTFDNTTPKGTFFIAGSFASEGFLNQGSFTKDDLKAVWINLYNGGHEIGNNSWSYPHGKQFTLEEWLDEIGKNNNYLNTEIGVSNNEVKGFRAPFLEYSQSTYEAIKQLNFLYGSNIESGFNGWVPIAPDTGWFNSTTDEKTYKKLYWPYTLDQGAAPGHSASGTIKISEVFEIQVKTLLKTDKSGVISGYDYNAWTNYTKAEFLEIMMFNYDLKREGNRRPFIFNSLISCYSQYNPTQLDDFPKSTWEERREAVEEFIDYVLQFPETRIVTMNNMLNWMRNPAPLQ